MDRQEITVDITTEWQVKGEESMSVTDELTLDLPSGRHGGLSVDFQVHSNDYLKWKQFLLAKGCLLEFEENPYLPKKEIVITATGSEAYAYAMIFALYEDMDEGSFHRAVREAVDEYINEDLNGIRYYAEKTDQTFTWNDVWTELPDEICRKYGFGKKKDIDVYSCVRSDEDIS